MRIFHIARTEDWDAARGVGSYQVSTLGRSLADVGFVHAAREDQVQEVFDGFYRGKRLRLLLLVIDTDLLTSPWSEDPVGETTYPHVHGPVNVDAVVHAAPLDRNGAVVTPEVMFVRTMVLRALMLGLVLVGAAVGATIAGSLGGAWPALAGLVVGGAIGYLVCRLVGQLFGPLLPAG